jgi:hypothetical protein
MRRSLWVPMSLLALAVGLSGCGSPESFESGNRLSITSITDAAGSPTPIFRTVENAADPAQSDVGTVGVRNTPRLGVEQGVPLTVFRIDLTYADAQGRAQDFAPAVSYSMAQEVPSGDEVKIEGLVLVPAAMKTAGLLDAVGTWTAVLDVWAEDAVNHRIVHDQKGFTFTVAPPPPAQAAGDSSGL